MKTKSKMNAAAKRWVKALRSGKYKQGRDYLHKTGPDRFCCLGVACDLYQKAVGGLTEQKSDYEVRYDDNGTSLPDPVMKWLGIKSACGSLSGGNLQARNDRGTSFKQIADIIEKHQEELFV